MRPISGHGVVGRWRIVEAHLWNCGYLDLLGPAFVVVQASLSIDYGPDEIGFTWAGSDEMDEARGQGSAELLNDGTLRIEFEFHLGDDAVFKAIRDPDALPD